MSSVAPASIVPQRLNLTLAVAFVLAHAVALLILPSIGADWRWECAALALIALGSATMWSLIHEGIHGLLLPQRAANQHLARALAILFGTSFRAVRMAHLRHHYYNRSPGAREEVYDPAFQSRLGAYAFHYLRITFGLYLGELALCVLCFMPRAWLGARVRAMFPANDDGSPGMTAFAERELTGVAAIGQIRTDAACVLILYGSAFALYGAHWPLLVACLALRALIVGQLDHAAHHGTPLDQRDYALNLSAPRWLRYALLGFNFHRTHHQHPNLPWTALAGASQFEAGDISMTCALLRQWRGPIEVGALSNTRHMQ